MFKDHVNWQITAMGIWTLNISEVQKDFFEGAEINFFRRLLCLKTMTNGRM